MNYTKLLPFSLEKMREKFILRHSQEKLIELAQSHLETKNFQDAVFFFKKVQDSFSQDEEKNAINQDIDKILELMKEEKKQEQEKSKTSQEGQVKPGIQEEIQNQKQASSQNPPVFSDTKEGVSLKIDNISFSGIEVSSGSKVIEVLNKIFKKNLEEQGIQAEEETEAIEKTEPAEKQSRVIEEQIFQEIIESRKIKPKELASNISEEDQAKAIELYNEQQRELAEKRKNLPPIEEGTPPLSGESVPLIDPETEKFYRKSKKKTGEAVISSGAKESPEGSGDLEQPDKNTGNAISQSADNLSISASKTAPEKESSAPNNVENKEYISEKENLIKKIENSIETGQPLQVQNVAPQPKIQKVNQFNLTYNFQNVFYNKFYLRYSGLFNEAARLVREKKLDEAIEYYQVLLEQKLPETMRLMVQQNVNDLKNTIVNTFKHADTIVQMDASGKLVRLNDIDTIRVFEEKEKGKNDVFFNETE